MTFDRQKQHNAAGKKNIKLYGKKYMVATMKLNTWCDIESTNIKWLDEWVKIYKCSIQLQCCKRIIWQW